MYSQVKHTNDINGNISHRVEVYHFQWSMSQKGKNSEDDDFGFFVQASSS